MHPIQVYLRGVAMGAADIVPGVSGGTIAFISGIYDTLIGSIKSFNLNALRVLKSDGIGAFLEHVNARFLLPLLLGILTSLALLASGIQFLLQAYPTYVFGFFFGLILASAWVIAQQMTQRTLPHGLVFLVGFALSAAISLAVPMSITPSAPIFFFAGAIAICAMILPGISGSFLLLLMGLYQPILQALNQFELGLLGLFLIGAVLGLLAFVRGLSFLLRHYHNTMLALLTGVMCGALFKVWPWKHTVSTRINHHGEAVPFIQENVAPLLNTEFALVCFCAVIGAGAVVALERRAMK